MKKLSMFIIALLFTSSFFMLPILPLLIPMHWNSVGQVDSYWHKEIAVWFIPFLSLGMLILFRLLPLFDPKKDNYKLFKHEWEIIQTAFIAFFAYLQFVIFYISINPSVPMLPLMFIGLGSLFVVMGNYLSKIRQNYFIGIKLPWTLSSEDNWNKTHRVASWCFVLLGIVFLAEAYLQWNPTPVVLTTLFVAVIVPSIYSYLLYRRSK